jgi:nucleoside-diphosphate-sugar epimerase
VIRKCIEARERGDAAITVWGTGKPTREFLFVDDAADAIVLATERYDGAEPVNIGSGSELTVRELVETIAELTGFGGRIVWDASRPDGQPRRCLDVSRAREAFGFTAKMPFKDGLRRTIAWCEDHLAGAARGAEAR